MSTTVSYKGNTIATVENNTKTLKTAGKYMEGDVVLSDESGGASNVVYGTFTTGSGGLQNVSIPYTGTGFPQNAYIEINGGAYDPNNSWWTVDHRYAIGWWCMTKYDYNTTPQYGGNYDYDRAYIILQRKNYDGAVMIDKNPDFIYTQWGATTYSETLVITFMNSAALSVYVSTAANENGLLPNSTYTYTIVYSS